MNELSSVSTPKIHYDKLKHVKCNSCDSDLPFSVDNSGPTPMITITYHQGDRCPECKDLFTGELVYHDWLPNTLYLKTKLIFD